MITCVTSRLLNNRVSGIPTEISQTRFVPVGDRGGHPSPAPTERSVSFTALRSSEVDSQRYG